MRAEQISTQVGNITHHKDTVRKRHSPDRQWREQWWQIFIAREGLLGGERVLSVGSTMNIHQEVWDPREIKQCLC